MRAKASDGASVIAGVLVGGAATRMGGRPKGMLVAPDGQTIALRCLTTLRAAGVTNVVLVGTADAYRALGVEAIADEPPGIGPLGGLVSLLARAGPARAIALACDMPFVSASLLRRLLGAPEASIVAPRRDDRWEPLCARYDAARVLPFARRLAASDHPSLQKLLDQAGAIELPLTSDEARELRDWDSPADLTQ